MILLCSGVFSSHSSPSSSGERPSIQITPRQSAQPGGPRDRRSSLPLGALRSARPGARPEALRATAGRDVGSSDNRAACGREANRPDRDPEARIGRCGGRGNGRGTATRGTGHYLGPHFPVRRATRHRRPPHDLRRALLQPERALPGDPIFVLTSQGLFRYNVTKSEIVSPNDNTVLDSVKTAPELTLTTCNPRYSASQRLWSSPCSTPPRPTKPTHSDSHPTSRNPRLPRRQSSVEARGER